MSTSSILIMTSPLLDSKLFSSASISSPFRVFNSVKAERKIIKFIRRTVHQSGAKGVVLGLSGGIDSALVAALSVKALGVENVHPIFFYDSHLDASTSASNSTDYSSFDLRDALILCVNFGLSLQKINLHDAFDSARLSMLSVFDARPASLSGPNSVFEGNLKSRLRMSLLYYYANQNNLLVLGTKNKTERLTGYFTKYGDGGVDLDPIADLYKTEVRLLSTYLNLPAEILNKTPSAGFWDGQSDEADLGVRYDQLDRFLFESEKLGLFEKHSTSASSPRRMKHVQQTLLKKTGLTQAQYLSVLSRIKSAEHKQSIPAFPRIS